VFVSLTISGLVPTGGAALLKVAARVWVNCSTISVGITKRQATIA
jgi:hypothetical protein